MAIIYVDVVFIMNVVIDYLLLSTTNRMLRKDTPFFMLLCGAVIGGFYTVLILCVNFSLFSSFALNVLFSALLMRLTFGKMRFKGLVRSAVMFYFVNFAFCGGIYAIASMLGMVSKGITFGIFAVYSAIAYGIISLVIKHRVNTLSKHKVRLVVKLNEHEEEVDCIVDTGNSLCTPYYGKPVIVAEKNALKGIIGDQFPENCEVKPIVIPFRSLGCDKGVIYGFSPDYMYLVSNGRRKRIRKAVIGLYDGNLSTDGNYKGLVHPSLVA